MNIVKIAAYLIVFSFILGPNKVEAEEVFLKAVLPIGYTMTPVSIYYQADFKNLDIPYSEFISSELPNSSQIALKSALLSVYLRDEAEYVKIRAVSSDANSLDDETWKYLSTPNFSLNHTIEREPKIKAVLSKDSIDFYQVVYGKKVDGATGHLLIPILRKDNQYYFDVTCVNKSTLAGRLNQTLSYASVFGWDGVLASNPDFDTTIPTYNVSTDHNDVKYNVMFNMLSPSSETFSAIVSFNSELDVVLTEMLSQGESLNHSKLQNFFDEWSMQRLEKFLNQQQGHAKVINLLKILKTQIVSVKAIIDSEPYFFPISSNKQVFSSCTLKKQSDGKFKIAGFAFSNLLDDVIQSWLSMESNVVNN